MGKLRRFLGFLTFVCFVVFGANAFAAGYSCPTYKKYTSCNSGYYLSDCGTTYDGRTISDDDIVAGNSCLTCPTGNYNCTGSAVCPKLNTVTITINKNGGSGTFTLSPSSISNGAIMVSNPTGTNNATITCVIGQSVAFNATPTKTNATNTGFSTSSSGTGTTIVCPSSDTTYYMIWNCAAGYTTTGTPTGSLVANGDVACQPIQRQITCSTNNSGGPSINITVNNMPQTVAHGDTSVTIPSATGYTFDSAEIDCSAGGGIEYLCNDANNGDPFTSIDSDGDISSFYGNSWDFDKLLDAGDQQTWSGVVPFVCEWTPVKATVSFNSNGGNGGQSESVVAEYDDVMPTISTTAPTRVGYTFMGWYDNADYTASGATQYYTAAGASAHNWDKTSATTLYAGWKVNTYTITLNDTANGGTGGTGTIKEVYNTKWTNSSDATITSVTVPTKDKNVFLGYYTEATGGTQKIPATGVLPATTTFTGTATLNAQFAACSCTAGTNVDTCTATGVTNNTCQFSYTCAAGWKNGSNTSGTFSASAAATASATSPNCTTADTGVKYQVCHYTKNLGTSAYTLDGGTCENKSGTSNETLTVADLKKTITGFTFTAGFAGTSAMGTTYPTSTAESTTTTVLPDGSRVISMYYSRDTHTVTLTKGTGIASVSGAGTYEYGASVTLGATASGGYTWSKWTQTSGGADVSTTNAYSFTMGTSNIAYTANATKNTYTVTLTKGTGIASVSGAGTYEYGATVTLGATASGGYTWSKWTQTSGGADVSTTNAYSFTMGANNIAYTANATKNTYTIEYVLDGGTHGTTHPTTYTVTDSTITISDPTKTGYTFGGWTVTTAPTAWGTGSSSSGAKSFKIATGTYGNIKFTAKWTANGYTITYKSGSDTLGTQTCTYGTPISKLTKFNDLPQTAEYVDEQDVSSTNGWSFGGWATDRNTSTITYTDGQTNVSCTGDMTLYPVWSRDVDFKYYASADATTVTTSTRKQYLITTNSNYISATAISSYPLYKSTAGGAWWPVGWTPDSGEYSASYPQTGATTISINHDYEDMPYLYAVYARSAYLSYNANGGSGTTASTICEDTQWYNVASGVTYNPGCELASNAFTAPTGYSFNKWAAGSATGTQYAAGAWLDYPNTTWTSGATYPMYATWTPITYTVHFNNVSGGAGTMSNQSRTYDDGVALTANAFTYGTSTFQGWATSSGSSTVAYADKAVANLTTTNGATVELYAVWGSCPACAGNTGVNCSVSVSNNQCAYTTSCKTGYKNLTNGGTANATCSPITYSVAYNSNKPAGASGSISGTTATSSHSYGTPKALTTNGYSLTGWHFNGWNTAANGSGTAYTNGQSVENLTATDGTTITLYAQWVANTFTIKYANGGGTGTNPSTQTCTYDGTNCTAPANPYTMNGSEFTGWACTASSGATCASATYASSASLNKATTTNGATLTLTAQWQTNSITLKWNPAYGTAPADTSCVYGGKFTAPAAPTVTGRTFTKWTTNGKEFTAGTEYDCNYANLGKYVGTVTFTGPYNNVNYTITYELNGGTNNGSNPSSYTIDSSAITLRTPTRDNSTFVGWYDNASFTGSAITSIPAGSTGNKTFYTKWSCATHYHAASDNQSCVLDTFNVTYSCGAGAGTPPAAATATYSQTYTTAANTCTRTDWVFNGWLVSGTTETKEENKGFTWTYTENKTLTAQWIQTACKAGEYLNTSTNVCESCPSTHPYSVAGAEGISACYDTCQTSCINPGENQNMPENASYCSYDPNHQVDGRKYFGGECTTQTICPYYAVTCKANNLMAPSYYDTGSRDYYNSNGERNTNICVRCPSSHPLSINGANVGINSCFVRKNYQCNQELSALTPSLATCELTSATVKGVVYYDDPIEDAYIVKYPGLSCGVTNCTCPTGYTFNASTPSCDPNEYTITLNDGDGNGGNGTIYETYATKYTLTSGGSTTISAVTVPTRQNWIFLGYFTEASGGTAVIGDNGLLPSNTEFTANTTLYAHWTRGVYTCTAGKPVDTTKTCAAGYYCPGGNVNDGEEGSDTVGCQRKCPTDALGGSISSAAGSTKIEDCFATRTGQDLQPNDDNVVTGGGDLVSYYVGTETNGAYTNDKSIAIKYCYAGYYRVANDSSTCSKVGTGYWSPEPTSTVQDNISMTRFPCSALPGYTNATTSGETSSLPTACYNTCADIDITDASGKIGTRVANPRTQSFNGTISAYDATNASVTTSGSYPVCTYNTPTCNAGYHASGTTCVPNVYTFIINKDGGTGGTNGPIYMKYNDGWYSDAGATNKITSITLPTKGAENCTGYTMGDTLVIGPTGAIVASNKLVNAVDYSTSITLKASWEAKLTVTCTTGQYYNGAQDKCMTCPAGSYCSGGTAFTGKDKLGYDQFIESCPVAVAGTNYTPAQNWNGTSFVNVATTATSAAGSSTISACYATVQYVASKGKGSRTCYYASGRYESECEENSIRILSCDSGYYRVNETDKDCTKVGYQYYSATNAITRERCPDANTDSAHISTEGETSELVTSCIRTGVWEDTAHGGRTTRCHYNPNSTNTNKYDTNCDSYTMRICAAGYWDALEGAQTTDADVDCVPVERGYFSPAQSAYTSEPAKPTEILGSSTKRTACPDSGTTATATSGQTNRDCYKACPTSITIAHGTTTVDVANVYYTGTAYPACTYTATCGTGYSAMNNGTTAPTCVARTYTVKYVANKPASATGAISGTTADSAHVYDVEKQLTSNGFALTGWTFAGWDTLANGSGTDYANTATVKNLTDQDNGTVQLYAQWTPNKYAVTYSCGSGDGTAPASAQATYDSNFTPASVGGCVKTGYSFNGWNDGTSNRAAGAAFKWAYTSAKTFTAQWTPNVYEITLDDSSDAVVHSAPNPLYMKYDTGWYTDAAATNPITALATLPTKTGYEFNGYKFGDVEIIDFEGTFVSNNFTAADTIITVAWVPGKTECAASYYYTGSGSTCALCEENFFCPGGQFTTDSGTPDGLNACPNGGASARGASANTACYADGLPTYVATYGSGTRTCYYNGTNAYDARCINNLITKCNAGYYYDAQSTTTATPDCVPVGQNYFSPADVITRTACPSTHPYTVDINSSNIGLCYANCVNATNATQMGGRNYYDSANGVCAVTLCKAGYYLKNGECTTCPAGYYCDGTLGGVGDGSTLCSATNANYPLSAAGSDDANDCYLVTAQKKYVANVGAGEVNCDAGNYCPGGTTVYVGGTVSGRNTTGGRMTCPANSYCVANVATPTSCGATNANYPLSAIGSDEANDCYLVTTAKNYVATVGAGETACVAGGYCPGGATIYVGGTHGTSHMTTGGRTTCPENSYCVANLSAPVACSTTNANYPYSAAGSDDANDCYLVTNQKKYVAVAGVGQTDCLAGNYCSGGTIVYVGGTVSGRATTGGSAVCPENNYCVVKVDSPTKCATTNANYPLSAIGSDDANDCYLVTTAKNYVAITGAGETGCVAGGFCPGGVTIYIGGNVNGRATIGGRTICPENHFCVANVAAATSCSTLGSGDDFTEWKYSPVGSTTKENCYSACVDRAVEYGHAYPVEELGATDIISGINCTSGTPKMSVWPKTTVNWPAKCLFNGVSNTCNPCKVDQLAGGTCVELGCHSDYEMKNGTCQLCNRENALAYEQTGNCVVAQCKDGYHPSADSCVDDVEDCTDSIPNATSARSVWDTTSKAFGICRVQECDAGYHVSSNACVPDEQTCAIQNGIGIQEWNSTTGSWKACEVTSCDPGYTQNAANTRCVDCPNKYADNGDLAASSYVRECEIASCMYQGEKYALQNGECVPICLTDSDETGSRRWDNATKRCVQTCAPGYVNW